ncbi:hypothetical protein EYF80_054949 [Liparis tanakae]|uniref:Uncharacterized protein n=1 Tax=Liparis tanakae TaxID=230148 RepID=A0A4Z2F1H3_9TELE|nr:hypothetical protein EYF80_054949 [Liparis tanakae]
MHLVVGPEAVLRPRGSGCGAPLVTRESESYFKSFEQEREGVEPEPSWLGGGSGSIAPAACWLLRPAPSSDPITPAQRGAGNLAQGEYDALSGLRYPPASSSAPSV